MNHILLVHHNLQNLTLEVIEFLRSLTKQSPKLFIQGKKSYLFLIKLVVRYGFLSENAKFVTELEKEKIIFIGPPAKSIHSMGSKSESKFIMGNAKVPIVPGYHGDN